MRSDVQQNDIAKKLWGIWVAIVLIVFVSDQWTKGIIQDHFAYNQVRELTAFFELTLRYNYGAAFSFLSDQGGWQRWFFTIIASVVSLVIVVWLVRIGKHRSKFLESLALAFILGGALGNLYDRATMGYVVDFLVFYYWPNKQWPAFNVADAAICLGAGLMILELFLSSKKEASQKEGDKKA